MIVQLETKPFNETFVREYVGLSEAAFGKTAPKKWIDALKWRLENMPDVTIFVATSDNSLVGFKAGYASAYDRYYSWLGAVHPDYQRRGIAGKLLNEQHNWLSSSRFRLLETQVAQSNSVMIAVNIDGGMKTSGMFSKHGEPYFIMEKTF